MIDLVKNRRQRLKSIFFCLALGIITFLIGLSMNAYKSNSPNPFDRPGIMLIFAFIGCGCLILLAKKIMTPLLQRAETYYEEGSEDDYV